MCNIVLRWIDSNGEITNTDKIERVSLFKYHGTLTPAQFCDQFDGRDNKIFEVCVKTPAAITRVIPNMSLDDMSLDTRMSKISIQALCDGIKSIVCVLVDITDGDEDCDGNEDSDSNEDTDSNEDSDRDENCGQKRKRVDAEFSETQLRWQRELENERAERCAAAKAGRRCRRKCRCQWRWCV